MSIPKTRPVTDPAAAARLAKQAQVTRDNLRDATTQLRGAQKWLFPDGEHPRVRWDVQPYVHPNPEVGIIAKKTPADVALIKAENALFGAKRAALDVFVQNKDGHAFGEKLGQLEYATRMIGYGTEEIANTRLSDKMATPMGINSSSLTVDASLKAQLERMQRQVDRAAGAFDSAADRYSK